MKSTNQIIKVKYHADFGSLPFTAKAHKDIGQIERGHTGIVVDYESEDWNYVQFIKWLRKHLLTFALTGSEIENLIPENAYQKTTDAAKLILDSEKNSDKKGEIGELVLHGLIIDIFKTTPLISKIYFKTDSTENVKGFDCVHVMYDEASNSIESLWLGEAKFHKDFTGALYAAFTSINGFLENKKMRKEFLVVKNHIDDSDNKREAAEALLDDTNSLDNIKARICVPILITYNSETVNKHSKATQKFYDEIEQEILVHANSFLDKKLSHDQEIDLHVFIMPLKDKDKALKIFIDDISSLQGLGSLY